MSQDDINHLYTFFMKEGQKLQKYLLRKSSRINEMDAEDIVDEVMLQLLSVIGMRGPIKNLPAYVYRALQNRMIDTFRQNERITSLSTPLSGEEGLTILDQLKDKQDVSSELENKLLVKRLTEAIDQLEPKQRAVYIATEFDDKTFKELSEEWNEPIGTLLSRKSRAVKTLQTHLKDLDPRIVD
jgi:RNA polymerase sigma factor (sigma-70 family)